MFQLLFLFFMQMMFLTVSKIAEPVFAIEFTKPKIKTGEIAALKKGWRKRANPHTWASSDENYLKSIFGSVSYCVVILRTTPHCSVRMTSRYFRLLTRKQHTKITFAAFAAWVQTNNKFQIIFMGQGDSFSYFILSCCPVIHYLLKAIESNVYFVLK